MLKRIAAFRLVFFLNMLITWNVDNCLQDCNRNLTCILFQFMRCCEQFHHVLCKHINDLCSSPSLQMRNVSIFLAFLASKNINCFFIGEVWSAPTTCHSVTSAQKVLSVTAERLGAWH